MDRVPREERASSELVIVLQFTERNLKGCLRLWNNTWSDTDAQLQEWCCHIGGILSPGSAVPVEVKCISKVVGEVAWSLLWDKFMRVWICLRW